MDETPFLEVNILDLKDGQIPELKKFHKSTFNIEDIFDTASELKYSSQIRLVFAKELQNPSDDFLRFFLSSVYSGMKTQSVIEKFRPVLKKTLNGYINELMNDKIKSALDANSETQPNTETSELSELSEEAKSFEPENKIVTTSEELEAYFIVKMLLKDTVPIQDITYKDTVNYLSILYQGKVTKWICRLILTSGHKILIIPDENKKETRYPIDNIYDIEKYKNNLNEVLKRYI